MKKTIPITLGQLAFTLNEDAYEKLKSYIDSIRSYFSATDSKETTNEIISDIESSIAVKFSEKLKNSKEVISIKDVDELIALMGSVDDIADSSNQSLNEAVEEGDDANRDKDGASTRKRLFRDTDDVIIAGVASGIANYFGIDPIFIRLLFVVSVFFGGAGIVIYLVLWLLVPKAKTATQRLEMQGDPITLNKLEKLVREKTAELKNIDKGKIRNIINSCSNILRSLIKSVWKFFMTFGSVIGSIIGVVIIVISILLITSIGSGLAALVFNTDSPYLNIPDSLVDAIGSGTLPLAALSVFFIIFVPIMFLILLGASMVKRKSAFNLLVGLILISVWMIAVVVFGVIALKVAPTVEKQIEMYNADSKMITKEIEVEGFDKIKIDSTYDVNIVAGEKYSVFVAGRDDNLDKINIAVVDQELIADREEKNFCLFCFGSGKIMLEITMPSLSSVDVSDSSSITVSGFEGNLIKLKLDDAVRGDFNIAYQNLDIELSDAAKLKLNIASSSKLMIDVRDASMAEVFGRTDMLEVNASDASMLKAYKLEAMQTKINVSDASKVQVNIVDNMEVLGSGVGRVYYYGSPIIYSNANNFILPGMVE